MIAVGNRQLHEQDDEDAAQHHPTLDVRGQLKPLRIQDGYCRHRRRTTEEGEPVL